MKKAISLICCLLIATMLVMSFSGCRKESSEKVQIVIWHTWNVEEGGGEHELKKIVEEYNASQDKVTVVLESQPKDGFSKKVYNAVANGVGPDIYFDFATSLPEYVDGGLVANMDDYMDIDKFNGRLKDAIKEEVHSSSDGHIHVVPIQSTAPVIFFNKSLYSELGLDAPKTWEDVRKNSEIIYNEKGIAGFAFDSYIDLAQILIYECGSEYINVDSKTIGFNTSAFNDQIEWVKDSTDKGHFAKSFSSGSIEGDFNTGLIAGFLGTCSYEPYIDPHGFDFGVVEIPSLGERKWSPIWNRGAIVMASDKDKEAAACDFVEYFTNAENNARWCISIGALSPYKDTDEIASFADNIHNDTVLLEAAKSMENGGTTPAVTGALAVRNELKQLFLQVIGDVKSINDALNEAEANSNKALNG